MKTRMRKKKSIFEIETIFVFNFHFHIFIFFFTMFRKFINIQYYVQKIRFKKIKIVYLINKFDDVIKCVKHFNVNRKIFVRRIQNTNSKLICLLIN